ncbi:MAG: MobF family relaxase [Rhodospirillaceae bacterium]
MVGIISLNTVRTRGVALFRLYCIGVVIVFTCVRIKDVGYYEKISEETKASRTSYYAGKEAESDGRWCVFGGGLCGIDEGSEVVFTDLERFAAGSDPRTGQPLLKSTRVERTSGYDLQFAPPKAISVAWACADAQARLKIEACGERAVRDALQFVHAEGLLECRRGKGGRIREGASGWLAAVFRHSLSRAGDPQLHWHAVVPNAALRSDMTTGGIDNKTALLFARAVGARFNASYAAELQRELGWSCVRTSDGKSFDVVGLNNDVGQQVCELFSKRRTAVVDAVGKFGTTTAESRESARLAAMNTRGAKTDLPPIAELEDCWREELASLNLTMISVIDAVSSEVATRPKSGRSPELAARSVAKAALALLTEQQGVFERRHLLMHAFEAAQGNVSPEAVAAALIEMEGKGQIVELGLDETGREVYSTPEYIAAEQRMLDAALHGRGRWTTKIQATVIEDEIAARELSKEQAEAVTAALSTDLVSIILGSAGTGKSRSLGAAAATVRDDAIRAILHQGGSEVHAIAPSWRATEVVRGDTETKEEMARAVTGFINKLRDGRIKLNSRSVLILDESSLVSTIDMSTIVCACSRASCKLILSGDVAQLQAVNAGSPLKLLAERLGVSRILQIRRQQKAWQREASMMLAEGRVDQAVGRYDAHGYIGWHVNRSAAVAALAAEWSDNAATDPTGGRLALAATHVECNELNSAIREVERSGGRLTSDDHELMAVPKAGRSGSRKLPPPMPITLAAGCRIIFGETVEIGGRTIRNADMATIVAIGRDEHGQTELSVRLDKDKDRADAVISGLWTEFVGYRRKGEPPLPRLSLAYAISVHSAQGHTENGKIYALSASSAMRRESLYVAMTRHRNDVSLHVATDRLATTAESTSPEHIKAEAIRQWSRAERKRNVADFQHSSEAFVGRVPDRARGAEQRVTHEMEM